MKFTIKTNSTYFSIIVISCLMSFSSCNQTKGLESKGAKKVITNQIYSDNYNSLSNDLKIHVASGIPYDSDTTDDYLIFRTQYALSYNKNLGVANWVGWELNKSWYGKVGRYSGIFLTDSTLPKRFKRANHYDYVNSGYTKGHMVRSKERTDTKENNISTFILTNVIPQTAELNSGSWLKFENFCQKLCFDSSYHLQIIAGGIYNSKNTLKNKGFVTIPDSCFKIVLVNKNSVWETDESTNVYAVVMPNNDKVKNHSWQRYSTTIASIENSTGYNFFPNLPTQVKKALENKK